MDGPAFALFGPGRLGARLALRLIERGWRCTAVRDLVVTPQQVRLRLPRDTLTDSWTSRLCWDLPALVLVTVPDDAIESAAGMIAAEFDVAGTTFLHTSGLKPSSALQPCRSRGATVASWHPLQSFPSVEHGPVDWDGVSCAIEGDEPAVEIGFRLATSLGLRPWRIDPADKPVYHASAAVACNLTHILVAHAADLMGSCGMPADGTVHPLQALVETSVRAALRVPDLGALTGPIAREDNATIEHHLRVLPPLLATVYRALRELAEDTQNAGTQRP